VTSIDGIDRAAPSWDEVCDCCEETYRRVESLLNAGDLAEALRRLQRNETELRRLEATLSSAARAGSASCGPLPPERDGAIAVPAVRDYAGGKVRSDRLLALMGRVGQLLRRCEAMQDETVAELRQLRACRNFEFGSSVAGAWFSTEA
jgi:hypothetical protein